MDLALTFGTEASFFELLDASTGEALDALLDAAGSFAFSPRSKWSHHIILVQIFVSKCFFFSIQRSLHDLAFVGWGRWWCGFDPRQVQVNARASTWQKCQFVFISETRRPLSCSRGVSCRDNF